MVLFNYSLKELTAKIVYYGPGLSGKTTNLQYIYDELPLQNKGRLLTLATETDRTLYFDFLPLDAGIFRGIKTRIQIYTVPGQVYYNTTRQMVLKGADGVVFVADSQRAMLETNLESLKNLRENLMAHGLRIEEIPLVMQYNKRDLPDTLSVEELSDQLNKVNVPFYESVATEGIGVEDTLKSISNLVLKSVIDKYGKPGAGLPRSKPAASVVADAPGSGSWSTKESTDPFKKEDFSGSDRERSEPSAPSLDPLTGEPKKEMLSPDLMRKATTRPSVRSGEAEHPGEVFQGLDLDEMLDGVLSQPEDAGAASKLGEAWEAGKDAILPKAADGLTDDLGAALNLNDPSAEDSGREFDLLVNELGVANEAPGGGRAVGKGPRTAPRVEEVQVDSAYSEVSFSELGLEEGSSVGRSHPRGKASSVELHIDAPAGSREPHRVVVPIRLSIDPDTEDIDLHLTIHIRINRTSGSS